MLAFKHSAIYLGRSHDDSQTTQHQMCYSGGKKDRKTERQTLEEGKKCLMGVVNCNENRKFNVNIAIEQIS